MKLDLKKSTTVNAKILKLSVSRISQYCKKNKIKLPDTRGKSPKVITNPFLLGNPDNDYWIGYLLGDGSLCKKGSNIFLYSNDKKELKRFEKHCKGVNFYEQSKKLTCYFGNKNIWNYLYNLGITPNKSLDLDIKFKLNWNIIRGLFDSDGSISKGEFKITSGSLKMIDKLDNFFKLNKFITRIVQKGNAYDIYIRYTNGSRNKDEALVSKKRLYTLLYEENNYFLERKHNKFCALIE